jgi:hypothetical protein
MVATLVLYRTTPEMGKRIMKYPRLIAASALACTATLGLALAQGTMSGVTGNWTVHTAAKTGCPGIALQVQRDGNNLKGFAETGDMAGVSRLTGTINANDQFSITITQVDGKGPQGIITGSRSVGDGWLLAEVKGSGCTDGPLKIQTEPTAATAG